MAFLGWSSLWWLPTLRQPTLVLAGRDDPLVPLINARILAWLIPGARLEVFDDGHLFLMTGARRVTPMIREFLAAPSRLDGRDSIGGATDAPSIPWRFSACATKPLAIISSK